MSTVNKFLAPIDYGTTMISSKSKIINVTTPMLIDSFDGNLFRSAEYFVQLSQGSSFLTTRMLLIHNGVNVGVTEYATVDIGTSIPYTFDATFSGTNLELTAQCSTGNVTPIELKYSRVLFDR